MRCEHCNGSGVEGYPSSSRFDVVDCPHCVDGSLREIESPSGTAQRDTIRDPRIDKMLAKLDEQILPADLAEWTHVVVCELPTASDSDLLDTIVQLSGDWKRVARFEQSIVKLIAGLR